MYIMAVPQLTAKNDSEHDTFTKSYYSIEIKIQEHTDINQETTGPFRCDFF